MGSLWVGCLISNSNIIECFPGGILAVYKMGGSDRASYREPQKIYFPEIFSSKKYLASKFSTQKKIQDVNTSILINSIKQTLRPKKYMTDLLTPKNTEGVNFQPQKNTSDHPVMYTAIIPLGVFLLIWQAAYWFTETEDDFCIKIEFNYQRTGLVHKYCYHFFVLKRQYGCYNVVKTLYYFYNEQTKKTRGIACVVAVFGDTPVSSANLHWHWNPQFSNKISTVICKLWKY